MLNKALEALEDENHEALQDVLKGTINFNRKIGQTTQDDDTLADFIQNFDKIPLKDSEFEFPDLLGAAYEWLIKYFADSAGKKAGEFYTPRSVVSLMVNILDPKPGETVYDPACGTGGLLLETLQHIRENGGDDRLMLGRLFGQEKNLTTAAIARMNLFLHGAEDFSIVRGDTLRQPAFVSGDRLATFDCVIANPPFSLKAWGEESWASDPWGRNIAGTPPKGYGDWAWVQHMYKSMDAKTGRIAVVLPQGSLFRSGAEGRIRQSFLEKDLIECVIGMAPNLFYGTGLAPCIIILRANKDKERAKKVLIINSESIFKRGRNQNNLEKDHLDQII
jgi:type I restriction enzyme M protein